MFCVLYMSTIDEKIPLPASMAYFTRIPDAVIAAIREQDVAYVVGCMAWFSNLDVIQELIKCQGVSIVTSHRNKVSRKTKFRKLYSKFKHIGKWPTVAEFESPRPDGMMHHKFLVAFGEDLVPRWLMCGSCNMTENCNNNRENILIIRDVHLALQYYEEFKRMLHVSKRLM